MIDWTKWDHLLGTMADEKIAEMIPTSKKLVQFRRYSLGIFFKRGRRFHPDRAMRLSEVVEKPAREPKKLGRKPHIWTEDALAMMADQSKSCREIAEAIGANHASVSTARRVLGLNRPRGSMVRADREIDNKRREMFGRMTSTELVEALGVSKQRVFQLAKRLGVRPQKKKLADRTGETIRNNLVLGLTDDGLAYKLRCPCGVEYTKEIKGGRRNWFCGQCHRWDREHGDEVGKEYNRLTIKKLLGYGTVECDCACGTKGFITTLQNVTKGYTKSCGCRRKEYYDYVKKNGWSKGGFEPKDMKAPTT